MIFEQAFIKTLSKDIGLPTKKHLQDDAGVNNGNRMVAQSQTTDNSKVNKVEILINRDSGMYAVTDDEVKGIAVVYNIPDLTKKLDTNININNPKYIRNTKIMLYYDQVAKSFMIKKEPQLKQDK